AHGDVDLVEDFDVAVGDEAVDLVVARIRGGGCGWSGRGLGGRGGVLAAAVMGGQHIGDDGGIPAHSPRVAAGDDDLLVLTPFDAVAGGNLDRAAMGEVEPLR